MERTLSIIKPDATKRNLIGAINKMIEEAGLKIVAQKMIWLSREQAGAFYAEHEGKSFYENLVNLMSSAPIVVQVLEAEDAITRYRKVMGTTNPDLAEEGTIRKTYALAMDKNSVHGSDSPASAAREISFFFSQTEIF
ncbi:MAG: nucleoside-diphosphate kinase [Alphaproteobacteria bacterium]|nr:nucleoside-diphosphate kinase [Alphaproteobacteria bacterium]